MNVNVCHPKQPWNRKKIGKPYQKVYLNYVSARVDVLDQ